MVCCVIKVRVFVQQGLIPRPLSGEMCPLTPCRVQLSHRVTWHWTVCMRTHRSMCENSVLLFTTPISKKLEWQYLCLRWHPTFCGISVVFMLYCMCDECLVHTILCMFVKAWMITTATPTQSLTVIVQPWYFKSLRPRLYPCSAASVTQQTVEKCL